MAVFLYALALVGASVELPSQPGCALTTADRAANAGLSFEDFDQKGTLPSTFRALSERGCAREAAEAAEDYLLNGPARTDYQQRIITWHMAQSLALAGEERQAAQLMAGTRVPTGNNENLDWNSYLKASWAFLVKDRPTFDAAAAQLAESSRAPDRINSSFVAGLGRCWAKPYRLAYNPDCMR